MERGPAQLGGVAPLDFIPDETRRGIVHGRKRVAGVPSVPAPEY